MSVEIQKEDVLILHIGPNSKFTQKHFIRIRKSISGRHLLFYSSLPTSDSAESNPMDNPYVYILDNPKYFKECLSKCSIAIIHHPSHEVHNALSKLSKDALAIWITWGGDIYSLIEFPLLKNKTLQLSSEFKTKRQTQLIKRIRGKLLNFRYYFYFSRQDANLYRFNVICGFPVEIDRIGKENLRQNVHLQPPIFPVLGEDLGSLKEPFAQGDGILIANSSSIENNLFDSCSDLESEQNLIAFVNYPNDDWQNYLLETTRLNFPNVKLVREYLDFEEWRNYFFTFESIYFSTIRNLGFVNILMGLQVGLKIYLDVNNPVFDFLKTEGFIIYCLEDFFIHKEIGFQMSLESKEFNRQLLHTIFSSSSYNEVEKVITSHILSRQLRQQ